MRFSFGVLVLVLVLVQVSYSLINSEVPLCGIDVESGRISDFNLHLELGSGHMAYHRVSLIDLYLIGIRLSEQLFVDGRTDGCTYGRTDGRTDGQTDIEAGFIRSTCSALW